MAQPLRVGVRIRQRDVAVRPDEVERRAQEAGSPHSRLPFKKVEWKLKLGADFGQAASQFPIYMNLPRQRSERGEVVFSRLNLDPGQAITASDGPGRARAQWTVAIVDTDLRDGVKQEAAHRGQSEHKRGDQGNELSADSPGDNALLRHQCECAIGGVNQSPREADPLRLIGRQQVVVGAAV